MENTFRGQSTNLHPSLWSKKHVLRLLWHKQAPRQSRRVGPPYFYSAAGKKKKEEQRKRKEETRNNMQENKQKEKEKHTNNNIWTKKRTKQKKHQTKDKRKDRTKGWNLETERTARAWKELSHHWMRLVPPFLATGMVAETYWHNLSLWNSSSAMMVVWFDVDIKGSRFSDTRPCEQRNLWRCWATSFSALWQNKLENHWECYIIGF